MLGELHAESVVRTAVQARDEALHRLFGEELQGAELAESVGLKVDGHVL